MPDQEVCSPLKRRRLNGLPQTEPTPPPWTWPVTSPPPAPRTPRPGPQSPGISQSTRTMQGMQRRPPSSRSSPGRRATPPSPPRESNLGYSVSGRVLSSWPGLRRTELCTRTRPPCSCRKSSLDNIQTSNVQTFVHKAGSNCTSHDELPLITRHNGEGDPEGRHHHLPVQDGSSIMLFGCCSKSSSSSSPPETSANKNVVKINIKKTIPILSKLKNIDEKKAWEKEEETMKWKKEVLEFKGDKEIVQMKKKKPEKVANIEDEEFSTKKKETEKSRSLEFCKEEEDKVGGRRRKRKIESLITMYEEPTDKEAYLHDQVPGTVPGRPCMGSWPGSAASPPTSWGCVGGRPGTRMDMFQGASGHSGGCKEDFVSTRSRGNISPLFENVQSAHAAEHSVQFGSSASLGASTITTGVAPRDLPTNEERDEPVICRKKLGLAAATTEATIIIPGD